MRQVLKCTVTVTFFKEQFTTMDGFFKKRI